MILNKELFNFNLEALQAEEYRNKEIEEGETQKLEWFCDAIQNMVEKLNDLKNGNFGPDDKYLIYCLEEASVDGVEKNTKIVTRYFQIEPEMTYEFQIKLVEIWYLNSNGIKEYCESLEFHFLDTEENTDPRESEYFDIWIGDLI